MDALIELLRFAARAVPDRPLIVHRGRTTTYAECLDLAEGLARGLRAEGIERFGCAGADPRKILALLAGASAAGSEPCVYPQGLDGPAIDVFARRFGHEHVVSPCPLELASAAWVDFRRLPRDGDDVNPPPSPASVLILTTGTTGQPKGARHEWSRLLTGVRVPAGEDGRRWLLAYNLNQFAGFQILLHVLATRATLVTPATAQARDVIGAMRDSEVTHVSATPTFWRLLSGGLDEASASELALEQITLGGEPAPASLMDRLSRLFPGARICHVYAGTEFGSVVSVADGRAGLPRSVLDRDASADVRLRIVDGELHISSAVSMLGYHGDVGTASADGWHRTGDLVVERGDRIHFVGRTTDVINVGGAKIHPLPIEDIVGSVDGVEMVVAYGRPNPVTGQLVALDVVAAPGFGVQELESAIREACRVLPAAGRPRRVRFVDGLHVHGNKLVRARPSTEA